MWCTSEEHVKVSDWALRIFPSEGFDRQTDDHMMGGSVILCGFGVGWGTRDSHS